MLLTGYLTRKKEYPEETKWVITSRGHYNELAPSEALYKSWHNDQVNWSEYREKFLKEMEEPGPQKRIKELVKLSREKDIRLICYEKPENHCHRHIIAELVKEAGGEVPSRKEREAPFFPQSR